MVAFSESGMRPGTAVFLDGRQVFGVVEINFSAPPPGRRLTGQEWLARAATLEVEGLPPMPATQISRRCDLQRRWLLNAAEAFRQEQKMFDSRAAVAANNECRRKGRAWIAVNRYLEDEICQ